MGGQRARAEYAEKPRRWQTAPGENLKGWSAQEKARKQATQGGIGSTCWPMQENEGVFQITPYRLAD